MKNCIKEWNVIVEALGQGKQTILIRKYPTNHSNLLLCPTFTYLTLDNLLGRFKENYSDFIMENILSNLSNSHKIELKYLISIEKVLKIPIDRIDEFDSYHIWTDEHIKSYLEGFDPIIWILRTYKLPKSSIVKRTRGMIYSLLEEKISIANLNPVISDEKYLDQVKKIEDVVSTIKGGI